METELRFKRQIKTLLLPGITFKTNLVTKQKHTKRTLGFKSNPDKNVNKTSIDHLKWNNKEDLNIREDQCGRTSNLFLFLDSQVYFNLIPNKYSCHTFFMISISWTFVQLCSLCHSLQTVFWTNASEEAKSDGKRWEREGIPRCKNDASISCVFVMMDPRGESLWEEQKIHESTSRDIRTESSANSKDL